MSYFFMAYARHISKIKEHGVENGRDGNQAQDEEEDNDFLNIKREYSTIK